MSDNIQLIIEIPESDYKAICANKEDAITAHDTCRRIANNGIPFDSVKAEIKEKCDRDPYVMFGIVDYMELPEPYKAEREE